MFLLQANVIFEKATKQLKLFLAIFFEQPVPLSCDRLPKPGYGAAGGCRDLDHDAAAIQAAVFAPNESGAFQSIKRDRHRALDKPTSFARELAEKGAALNQHAKTTQISPVDAKPQRGDFVHRVGGALGVGDQLAQGLSDLAPMI